MTAEEKITDFLMLRARQAFCDDCLSSRLAILPRQQVQQKTAALGEDPRFVRAVGRCDGCRKDRLVIRARVPNMAEV